MHWFLIVTILLPLVFWILRKGHNPGSGFMVFLALCLWAGSAEAQVPAGYWYQYDLAPPSGGSAVCLNVPILFTEKNLPQALMTGTLSDSSGTTLQLRTSTGTAAIASNIGNRLPLEVVGFTVSGNTANQIAEVWGNTGGSAGGSVSYIPAYPNHGKIWLGVCPGTTQPSSSAAYGSQAVWANGYVGVWHMSSTGALTDSTSNSNTLAKVGAVAQTNASGVFGPGALGFTTSACLLVSKGTISITGSQPWTMSTWVKENFTNSGQGDGTLLVNGIGAWGSGSTNYNIVMQTVYGGDLMMGASYATSNAWLSILNPQANGVWYHIVSTFDGTTMRGYAAGTLRRSGNFSGATALAVTSGSMNYGNNGNQAWHGSIQEGRVYSGVISAAQIANEYANQSSPATYLTVSGSGVYCQISTTDGASSYADTVSLTDGSNVSIPCTLTLSGGSGMVTGYGTSASSASLITNGGSLNAGTVTAAGGTFTLGNGTGSVTYTGTATTGGKLITSDGTLTNISVTTLTGGTGAGNLTITNGTAAAGTLVSGAGTTAITGGKFYGGTINLGASSYAGTITGSYSGGSTFTLSGSQIISGVTAPSGTGTQAGSAIYLTGTIPAVGGVTSNQSSFTITGTSGVTTYSGSGLFQIGNLNITSGSSSAVVYNTTFGPGNSYRGTAPVPGPFMMSAHRQVDANTLPAKRFSVRIVERGGKLTIEVED